MTLHIILPLNSTAFDDTLHGRENFDQHIRYTYVASNEQSIAVCFHVWTQFHPILSQRISPQMKTYGHDAVCNLFSIRCKMQLIIFLWEDSDVCSIYDWYIFVAIFIIKQWTKLERGECNHSRILFDLWPIHFNWFN